MYIAVDNLEEDQMAKRTKVNLTKWIKEIWYTETQLGFIEQSFDDPEIYRNRLSNIIRKAIVDLPAESLVEISGSLDINIAEKLWTRTLTRMNKDDLVQAIVTGGYGYNTEEDVWAAMEYDLSDNKRGKKRSWYAFWSREDKQSP